MKILAIEFSSPQKTVAVLQAGSGTGTVFSEVIETGTRATNALSMIEESLREAQMEREQIECVAVGLGPGSYNGLRGAIALAQGWQLARGVKLLGISSAQCVAAQAEAEGITGPISIAIDAQRGEFYLASYEIGAQGLAELQPLALATREEVLARQEAGGIIVGPEVSKWFARSRIIFPRASMLGQLALTRNDFVPGEKLEPIYLRETQFVKAPRGRIIGD